PASAAPASSAASAGGAAPTVFPPNTPAPKPLPKMTDVSVAQVNPGEYLAPFYLAMGFGEFAKENLNVTMQRPSQSDSLVLMKQGKVQGGRLSMTAGLFNAINTTDDYRQVGNDFLYTPEAKAGLWIRKEYYDASGAVKPAMIKGMKINMGTGGLAF